MVTVSIQQWNDRPVWTAWSVQPKTHLVDLLRAACPSLRQTEIKRLARRILNREQNVFELQNGSSAHSLVSFLQGLGASATLIFEDKNSIAEEKA